MGRACSQNGGRMSAFNILTGKPSGKIPLKRPRPLEETGINTRNWVDLALDKDYWRALVNAAMTLRIP